MYIYVSFKPLDYVTRLTRISKRILIITSDQTKTIYLLKVQLPCL